MLPHVFFFSLFPHNLSFVFIFFLKAEESVQLLRAKGDASDVALPLLRGQLLDAASSRATAAERQAAASQRETARVSAALAEAQRKATAEVTGLRSEVRRGVARA